MQAGRIKAGERIELIALASGLEIGVVLLTLDEGMVARHGNVAWRTGGRTADLADPRAGRMDADPPVLVVFAAAGIVVRACVYRP